MGYQSHFTSPPGAFDSRDVATCALAGVPWGARARSWDADPSKVVEAPH